jgi:replicative DNA helicase
MRALVPALDLRPPPENAEVGRLPANVEAEQALLGVLLYDNAAYERLGDYLRPQHFYEPFHQRLFEKIEATLRKGQLADPILMMEAFPNDPGFEGLGGVRYLADLIDRAPPISNAPDYAREVYDLAIRRNLITISADIARGARLNEDDLSGREQVEAAESALYGLVETGATSEGLTPFAEALREAVEMAAEAHQRDGGLAGLSTGLLDLDHKIGGMHRSDLMILAARPSMGKTSLACNIAFDVARSYAWEPQPDGSHKTIRGGRVAFFSLEMSRAQLAMRLLAEASGISSDRLRKGELRPDEFGRVRDAALEIEEAPLYIDATGGLTLAKLCARARRMKRRHGLDLVIVDYLQLVTLGLTASRPENRVQEVSAITVGLKALAKELNVPVLALSQLSRQVENREDKKPQLADLRESGSIEQDADMVMFLYREAYYLSRLEPREDTAEHANWRDKMDTCRGLADLIIGKQRHGPIGTVKLSFNEALTKFGNLARDGFGDRGARAAPLFDPSQPRYSAAEVEDAGA